jgi:DNA-binding transcriptional MerR regulator
MQRASVKSIKKEKIFPDKLFYKIGEVSQITGVEPYVLRYWETEFPFLKPRKNKSGQRVYVKKDLEQIIKITELLYKERYTIEGVRKRLGETAQAKKTHQETEEQPVLQTSAQTVEYVKKRLRDLLDRIK